MKKLIALCFVLISLFILNTENALAACSGFCSFNSCEFGNGTGTCNLGLNCCNFESDGTPQADGVGCVGKSTGLPGSCQLGFCTGGTTPDGINPPDNICVIGYKCCISPTSSDGSNLPVKNGPPIVGGKIDTAIGKIPITDEQALAEFFLRWGMGLGGGIALILIVVSTFMIMTSEGDPRKLQAGKELLTSAIAGLMLLVFSAWILNFIGVKILDIFGSAGETGGGSSTK